MNRSFHEIRLEDLRAEPAVLPTSGTVRRDGLMVVGVLLTTATQFRLPGSPFGPGEFFLIVWMGIRLCVELARLGPPLTPALTRMLLFWTLFALAQSLGTLTGLAIGDQHDEGLFWHDAVAYTLVAAVSCLSVAGRDAWPRMQRNAELLALLGAVALFPQLVAGCGGFDLPMIEPWFGDRFRGWSNNPNQLAFLCAILVLISLHLVDTADRPRKRFAAILYMIPAAVVGRLTKTDTFTFALLGALPVFMVLKLRFWLVASGHVLRLRTAFAWTAVIAAPLLLVSVAPLAMSLVASSDQVAMSLMKGNGKEASGEADLRLVLWGEALDRGLQGYMLGLGPGPHLPIPPELVAARRTEPGLDTGDHPTLRPTTPNFEAHNSPLDLFTQGGLIAVGSFLWLVAMAFVIPYRARFAGLAALMTGVAIFGLTNNIVRPPTFWFAVAFCLTAGDRALGRVAPTGRNSRESSAAW